MTLCGRLPRLTALLAALTLLGVAAAQPRVVVGGVVLAGASADVVPGVSYAPAEALADAMGLDYLLDLRSQTATFRLGARVAQLALYLDAAAAAAATDALRVDARPTPGSGGVLDGGEVMVPVAPLVRAFGGSVAYQPETTTVTAVLPRARLERIEPSSGGLTERFTLRLSAPIPYSSYYNEPLNTLQIRFERTDVASSLDFDGRLFLRAAIFPGRGYTDFRIELDGEVDYTLFDAPSGEGFELVIDLSPRRLTSAPAPELRPHIVIDPGHGGEDTGVAGEHGGEGRLTLDFARALAAALEARGVQVSLTRDAEVSVPLSSRSSLGVGADLFVSIHAGASPPGSYQAYFLGDADDLQDLTYAVRQNAAGQLDATLRDPRTQSVRRQILLDLVPDLEVGRRYADALGRALLDSGGYSAGPALGAPLVVLAGAAGRGLLLEFSPADLGGERLLEPLAASLVSVLGEAAPR